MRRDRQRQSRTLIIGIMVLANRPLSAAQLIALAEPLGLSATNVKSHLTRMVREGVLKRQGPARLATYRPADDQMLVVNGIKARLRERRDEAWDGKWLMLTLKLPRHRGERERLRAALWFDGFRPVNLDVFVRPAWPHPWAQERASAYAVQFGGACLEGSFVAAPSDPRALYDLDGLHFAARRLAAWIRARRRRCRSPRAAFVERMNVGGRVAQLIGHDPRLPQAVWGRKRSGMREVVTAFHQFEAQVTRPADAFVRDTLESH
jgi:DNA-binding transcriptional regulator PaaX